METASKILISFGFGLVAGAVIGVMLAPASGEETRKKLSKISHDSIDYFLQQAEERLSVARDTLNEMHENQMGLIG